MELTFANSEVFAPWLGANLHPSEVGTQIVAVNSTDSQYATIVPENGANKTVDCIINIVSGITGATYPSWPNDGHIHGGVGLRWNGGSSDMAGLVMISPAAGELQIVDRFGGTEYIVARRAIAGGLDYNQNYRLLIENPTGNDYRVRLYHGTTGTLLDDFSWTLTVGSAASGNVFIHVFACTMAIYSFKLYDSAGATVIDNGTQVYAGVYPATPGARCLVSGGALDLFCNGANGSVNSWAMAMSIVKRGDCVITGTMKRVSAARIMGIVLRHSGDSAKTCYVLYHDTSGGLKFSRFSSTTFTGIQTLAKTLTTGVAYPFTITVSGTSYTLEIDGTTFGPFTDATYTNEGYIGFFGFQVNAQFSDVHILESPTITSHPASATKDAGEGVTFSVVATGDPAPTYQWRKDGVNIGGATSADYTIASVAESDEGDYDCVVTNSEGSATSNVATLTVNSATSNWWITGFRLWRRR